MKLAYEIKAHQEAALRLLFPQGCDLCQNLLTLSENGICRRCRHSFMSLSFPIEKRAIDQKFTFLDGGWALFPYTSHVKELLAQIKFQGKRWLLELFKNSISEWASGLHGENHYDLIIPIPLASEKLLNRQFNQSGILADFVGRKLRTRKSGILKKYATPFSQSRLNRKERLWNLTGAFYVGGSTPLRDKSVLLIDDILTTGATAEEAAQTLKRHGAKRVDVLVVAYTDRRRPAP